MNIFIDFLMKKSKKKGQKQFSIDLFPMFVGPGQEV